MWRPENWLELPIPKASGKGFDLNAWNASIMATVYEKGAEAMLLALKDKGKFTYGNHTPDIDLDDAPEISGYWCFIPEE